MSPASSEKKIYNFRKAQVTLFLNYLLSLKSLVRVKQCGEKTLFFLIQTFISPEMASGNYPFNTAALVLSVMICQGTSFQCGREQSTLGMMLRQHVFKKIKGVSLGVKCLQSCNDDVRCQSFNYVISQGICELNNRTKEARPEDFIPDSDRYYFKRDVNRGTVHLRF